MHRAPILRILSFSLALVMLHVAFFAQAQQGGETDPARCWARPASEMTQLAGDRGGLFATGRDARLAAFSLEGDKLWTSELGGDITSNLLLLENSVVVAASAVSTNGSPSGTAVRSLSRETGIAGWSTPVSTAPRHFLGRANGSVIVVSSAGTIEALDPATGAVRWRRQIAEGFAGGPAMNDTNLFVASRAGQLFAISVATGEIDSTRKLTSALTVPATAGSEGGVVVGDERGNITALENVEKLNWRFKTGGSVSALYMVDGSLLAASHDNFVYFLSGRNGAMSWKKRLSGRATRVGLVNGTYALVSSIDEHGATLLDLASGRVAGQILLGPGEVVLDEPVTIGDRIFILTNEGINSFGLRGCIRKEEAARVR